MITRLILKGLGKISKGLDIIARPSVFDGYTIDYSNPVSEPCPGCGHTTYHTDNPEIAFCPCCRRTLYIYE